jgi:hypothetical protein
MAEILRERLRYLFVILREILRKRLRYLLCILRERLRDLSDIMKLLYTPLNVKGRAGLCERYLCECANS